MAVGNILSSWALLLLAVSRRAKAQVGVSICACQPSVYTFKFNFTAVCDVGTVDFRDGVNGADCFMRGVGLGSENTVDAVPVQITTISIMELDKSLRVMAQTPYVGDFRHGDTIKYTSVAATAHGVSKLNPDLMPGGIQLDMVGINQFEEPITNVWIILFENDCGIFPVLEVGDLVGWTKISDLTRPRSDVCPIAATESPTKAPSISPYPTIAPLNPTVSPSESPSVVLASDETNAPFAIEALPTLAPVCVHAGKSGGKSGTKAGKSRGSGKSGKSGGRNLEGVDGYSGKGYGKGNGKGYHDDECLPEKKSKPQSDDSHKKIEKGGKSGKGKAGKSGKSGVGKAGVKAGKAAKKRPLETREKLQKSGKSGKGVNAETKAITFGKGKGHQGSVNSPTRIPKKNAPSAATRMAKLAKPLETVGDEQQGPTTVAPTLRPYAPPSFIPTVAPTMLQPPEVTGPTMKPTTHFTHVNSQYLQSRMSHLLHQQENIIIQEGSDGRLLRR